RTTAPLVLLAMGLTLLWGIQDLALPIQLSIAVWQVVYVFVMVAAIVWVARLVDVASQIAASWSSRTESRLDDQLIPLIRQAARVLVLVVGLLFVLDAVGVDVWKLAAGVGIGGLAFALAAQDTVANVFGSIN